MLQEWRVTKLSEDTFVVDSSSAREVMRIHKPQFNHNGGALTFGPDRLLYLSVGDGGAANDSEQTQNLQNGGGLGGGARAVIRRYEHYAYNGSYDPITHAVACGGDGTCSTPQAGELGGLLGAQNAAANLIVPSVIVSGIVKSAGAVVSTDGTINCPALCTANYAAGKQLTLTAIPARNYVFTGWTGACSGNIRTCQPAITDVNKVAANFVPTFVLQVLASEWWPDFSDPRGRIGTSINCGSDCSASYQAGSVVTFTANPIAPAKFTGWSGACSGTLTTCSLTVTATTKVQANYK